MKGATIEYPKGMSDLFMIVKSLTAGCYNQSEMQLIPNLKAV